MPPPPLPLYHARVKLSSGKIVTKVLNFVTKLLQNCYKIMNTYHLTRNWIWCIIIIEGRKDAQIYGVSNIWQAGKLEAGCELEAGLDTSWRPGAKAASWKEAESWKLPRKKLKYISERRAGMSNTWRAGNWELEYIGKLQAASNTWQAGSWK